MTELSNIRIRDLEIFAEVARAKSIREVARRLTSTSGQVSKAIRGLERRLGTQLFRRSASGVLLTSQGNEILALVSGVLDGTQKIESFTSGTASTRVSKTLAVAGTAFLNTCFTAPLIAAMSGELKNTTFRFLDLPPDDLVSTGLRGGFELAVHFGDISWPTTWISTLLGRSRWVLCARSDHPLAKRPTLRQILEYRFVLPTYWTREGLVRGNDQFPISITKRKPGFETATADAAVPIVRATDQLAFLPELLVQPFLDAKTLREIRNNELAPVKKDLYLSGKADAISAMLFAAISKKMSNALMR